MKIKAYIILISLMFSTTLLSQFEKNQVIKQQFSIGTEVDLLPFCTGGYYGSIVLGYNNYRVRPIYSKANQPGFVLPDGFDKNQMDVYAILFDYFFNHEKNIKGWWIGVGYEFWKNNVKEKNSKKEKDFNTYIFTVGGGYTWFITENIYLNPWCAGHLTIAGETDVKVGEKNYKSKLFLPEVSLKIGIVF